MPTTYLPLPEAPPSEAPLPEAPPSVGPCLVPRHVRQFEPEQALIKEARQRRRRRRLLIGLVAILLVAAATCWRTARQGSHSPTQPAVLRSDVVPQPCASQLHDGPLPIWARAGFHPANMPMPYVLGAHKDIIAILWGWPDPLSAPPRPNVANKVLWVSRLSVNIPSNLYISARRVIEGQVEGAPTGAVVQGGPGPSLVNMPTAGCWQLSLRWSGHRDLVDLAYMARRR